jgi:hypothetical protein
MPNCAARTSSAARKVKSAIPVPRGSTTTIHSRRLARASLFPCYQAIDIAA